MVALLAWLQSIIRANGGECTFGSQAEVEKLIEAGAKIANRWILSPTKIQASDVHLATTCDTFTFELICVWAVSPTSAQIVEQVAENIRDTLDSIQTEARTSDLQYVEINDAADVEWLNGSMVTSTTLSAIIGR